MLNLDTHVLPHALAGGLTEGAHAAGTAASAAGRAAA
jgi:hypothetical protein